MNDSFTGRSFGLSSMGSMSFEYLGAHPKKKRRRYGFFWIREDVPESTKSRTQKREAPVVDILRANVDEAYWHEYAE